MQITRIPRQPMEPELVRVAAYARVSADKEMAFHSLDAQVDNYERYVLSHPGWVLVEVYSDGAISGTVVERPEFQRMMEDCRAKKIDRIITKSITRFARNTVALLAAVRELKDLGIDVFFEKEDLHSISPDGELLLTFLALYAEEEARSASENQRWRIRKKFEQGQTTVGKMLGYRLKDGKLVVVPEEAEIVRWIYTEYLSGKSINKITKELNSAAIPAARSCVWNAGTVTKILKNEKYTGSMILQKTYCPDFRTKKQIPNNGQVPMYEVTGSHEAIIPLEQFNDVQQKLAEVRAERKGRATRNTPTLFAGLMKCGQCGSAYCRRNNGSGKYHHFIWTCRRYDELGKAACPAQAVPEEILIEKTKEALGADALTHDLLLTELKEITVPGRGCLVYHFKSGETKEIKWQHHSRRESWTPTMRQAARERGIKQHRKEGDN